MPVRRRPLCRAGRAAQRARCHCEQCRRATGGAFYARIMFRQADVVIEGETRAWSVSSRIERVFCPTCGSTLFSRSIDERQVIGLSLSSLDDPTAAAPTEHIFVSEKFDWLKLDDGLPQYPQRSP